MASGFAGVLCVLAAAAAGYSQSLTCEVQPFAPVLTYRLVYRAGFVVSAPMAQFGSGERALTLTVEVRPQRAGAKPLLMRDTGELQKSSNASKFEVEMAGGFFLGEGEYRAKMTLTDDRQRACRKSWRVSLKPHVKTELAPGQLKAFSQVEWPHPGRRRGALTVLFHAGSREHNTVLVNSLAAILGRMRFSHVEVVAFSLDQHKELLRQEVKGPLEFQQVVDTIEAYNPQTVSYGVLKDPAGHRNLLWQLMAKESLRPQPPEAVVFLGYSTLEDRHVYVPPACKDGSHRTVYAYLDFAEQRRRDPRHMLPPELPDAISRVTHACSGKVFYVHSPAELASAVDKVNALIGGRE
jgi:hypothetical protein